MTDGRRSIQSIEIGGQLLQALVEEGGPMTLRDLARRAGMTSAKAHPYLVSFGKFGLVQQDPLTSRYELGPFALQMGLITLQRLDPVRVAVPEITRLAETIDQTVALAVLGSHGATIVYLCESSQPIHVNMHKGSVMSTLNTATGRVFAAYLAPGRVAELIAREIGDAATVARLGAAPLPDEVERQLEEVRLHHMARAVNGPVPGINALSAPVFDHSGAITLAITAIGPTGTFDPDWNGPIALALAECAAQVSARIGFRR